MRNKDELQQLAKALHLEPRCGCGGAIEADALCMLCFGEGGYNWLETAEGAAEVRAALFVRGYSVETTYDTIENWCTVLLIAPQRAIAFSPTCKSAHSLPSASELSNEIVINAMNRATLSAATQALDAHMTLSPPVWLVIVGIGGGAFCMLVFLRAVWFVARRVRRD